MSADLSGEITAIATAILAAFAIVTAIYAVLAFRKQSQEVSDQASMLKVQSEQLAEQQRLGARQVEVLDLQSKELGASLRQRELGADQERRGQAVRVTAWFVARLEDLEAIPDLRAPNATYELPGAIIRNASELPIFDVRALFYGVSFRSESEWEPVFLEDDEDRRTNTIRVLPPRSDRLLRMPASTDQLFRFGEMSVVGIQFTDAAGNHWERGPRGALVLRT